jgi:hypothetical protein
MYYNKHQDLFFGETIDYTKKEAYDHNYRSKTNVHMGQRKLLLSEIQLLTKYYQLHEIHPTVLYVGAAPGTHLLTLSDLFPNVKFILYDANKFDFNLRKKPNIFKLYNEYFTDEKCDKIKENQLIFISDIRLSAKNQAAFDNGVMRDLELQKNWVQTLKPVMSLLKFRMSYQMKHGDKLSYMKGDILYGIWPKPQSGETRLLVYKNDIQNIIDYDYQAYEESMFYHNKYRRAFCKNDIPDKFKEYIIHQNIYCSCYDCISELNILDEYAKLFDLNLRNVITIFGTRMNWNKTLAFQKNRDPVTLPLTKLELPHKNL